MTNLSQVEKGKGHYDFTRVESIEMFSFTTGACNKLRQNVVMTMFSGKVHKWGEYVERQKAAIAKRDALLKAVEVARAKMADVA